MKANKKVIQNIGKNDSGYVKVVGGLIALLLMIIVAILVYWETQGAISAFEESSETITSDIDGTAFVALTTNASAWVIELGNTPTGTGATNITCFNSTSKTESFPAFTLSNKQVSVAADAADYFDQVNATYTSNMASNEDGVSDMATTVFDLLPVIALAVVASIILGIIIGFGGSGKRL